MPIVRGIGIPLQFRFHPTAEICGREKWPSSLQISHLTFMWSAARACVRTYTTRASYRESVTVIRSNNDTTVVIHPRDCARDRRAFYAAHELRAIIFTSVVYLRARIIRRASGWNKIPGPFPPDRNFLLFSPANSARIYISRCERSETLRNARRRRKLWPRDGRESAFGAAYEHDIRDTDAVRDQLYNCDSLRSLLSPARVAYIKVFLEALSIEKRYMGEKMK